MARQPPGGGLPGIDSEISPRRNRAYSPTARFMECVAFRTHPFQAQVSSVEQPWGYHSSGTLVSAARCSFRKQLCASTMSIEYRPAAADPRSASDNGGMRGHECAIGPNIRDAKSLYYWTGLSEPTA